MILCDLNQNIREHRCSMEENSDIPSVRELYNIILELGLKYNKIETELEELKRWVNNKKNKFNILDWLNSNKSNINLTTFDWIESIEVTHCDIQTLFNSSISELICNLFNKHIEYTQFHNQTVPLFNCSDKSKSLYIYELNEIEGQDSLNEWKPINSDDFMKIIKSLHKKITIGMRDWYNRNKNDILNNEKIEDIYNKTLLKIMDVELQPGSRFITKIKSDLCNLIKSELTICENTF